MKNIAITLSTILLTTAFANAEEKKKQLVKNHFGKNLENQNLLPK